MVNYVSIHLPNSITPDSQPQDRRDLSYPLKYPSCLEKCLAQINVSKNDQARGIWEAGLFIEKVPQ